MDQEQPALTVIDGKPQETEHFQAFHRQLRRTADG